MSRESGPISDTLDDAASTRKRQRLIPQPARAVTRPSSPVLLDDLIVEILSRLPVKSLLRFRCVCKPWKSIISSSYFVKKHLHRSATDPNLRHHRFVVHDADYVGKELLLSRSLRSLFENPSSSSLFSSPVDAHFELSRYVLIVGSCNGLICWVNYHRYNHQYFHFLNPSTRLRSRSPCFHHPWRRDTPSCTMFGFGYDHVTDTYKAVGIYCDPNAENFEKKTLVKVYALGGLKCWRKIQSLPFVPRRGNFYDEYCGKFASGTLNWLAARPDGSLLVVSVDLGKETCREVLLPDVVDQDNFALASPKLWDLGGCLCFSYDSNGVQFVLWQMKEYGVKESWTKLLNISYLRVGFNHLHHYYPRPVFMLEKDEVLLQIIYHGVFILYNPKDNSWKYIDIENYRNWCVPKIYIESLVSPRHARC